MGRICSTLNTLRTLLRSESGFAVPTVLALIVIGLGLAGAAGVASIIAQRGSIRDQDTKQALAAADAGAFRALFRQNQVATTDALPCIVIGSAGELVPGAGLADGWCPEISGSVGSTTYRYRVKPPTLVDTVQGKQREIKIVSTGTSDEVSRRIALNARAITGARIFGQSSLLGLDEVVLDSNARAFSNAASNGSIIMRSNALLCGDASYGVGGGLVMAGNAEQCGGFSTTEAPLALPLIDQGDVTTNNSNGRLVTGEDVLQGKDGCATPDKKPWDPATRTFCLDSNSALTLGGSNYSFCRLILNSNSTLYIAEGALVRVFFDAPENCIDPTDGQPYTAEDGPVEQFVLESNTKIDATSGDPTSAAFFMVGSDTIATTARLSSNSQAGMDVILYAPRTDVDLNSNSTLNGAVAGKTVTLDSNAVLQADDRVSSFEVPVVTVYRRDRYVECAGSSGTPPDANC